MYLAYFRLSSALHQRTALQLLVTCLFIGGCTKVAVKSPEELRQKYANALQTNNPDAAYKLLSPRVQARVSLREFKERWSKQKQELAWSRRQLEQLDTHHQAPLLYGETSHPGGMVLKWAYVGDRFLIVDGLPTLANRSTPQSTLRSFISALRAMEWSKLTHLMSDQLADKLAQDWLKRANTIEQLLQQPGAIELSPNLNRALLRYEAGRAIVLEQSPQGWRIIRLQ